ncbi:hypothetical protein [Actinomadura sp. 7K534]|uniref:hypothetical protein n=1 Tax=Actinomadura sp. 7K534 TaxID=2530366 RepID=UPI00104FA395|nr:hypothetical protein [Actinomadura sp. 7K534]TDB90727.1 hypothetical protein E1266_27720 [Actinomadura sp. 7K534]
MKLLTGGDELERTLLALQFRDALSHEDWLAGVVNPRASATEIRNTGMIERPLLAVVEAAESHDDQVIALAEALAERSALRDVPARLLLVSDSSGEWLARLRDHDDERISGLFREVTEWNTLTLSQLHPDRAGQFHAARSAFAQKLGVLEPVGEPPTGLVRCRTLSDVHAAALTTILSPDADLMNPLDDVIMADLRHWRRMVQEDGRAEAGAEALTTIAAVTTLCRPDSAEEVEALLSRLPDITGLSVSDVTEYTQWLRRLYPGQYLLKPIRPIALGEHVMATTMAAVPSIPERIGEVCPDEMIARALTVLGGALPRHPELAPAVTSLVRADPERLVLLGTEVAIHLAEPEPFSRALGAGLNDGRLSVTGIWKLLQRVARSGQSLDPLKPAVMKAYTKVFAKPLMDQTRERAEEFGPLKPVHQVVEQLLDYSMDMFEGFLDPKSDKFPKEPDGKESVPQPLLDLARKLIYERDIEDQRRPKARDERDGASPDVLPLLFGAFLDRRSPFTRRQRRDNAGTGDMEPDDFSK